MIHARDVLILQVPLVHYHHHHFVDWIAPTGQGVGFAKIFFKKCKQLLSLSR
jgi:hypothetical protein